MTNTMEMQVLMAILKNNVILTFKINIYGVVNG
jgi:hypothetical protein